LSVPTSLDPYKCYHIKDEGSFNQAFTKRDVVLVDQYGKTRTAVLKPFFVCNPAIETNLTQTPGTHGSQVQPLASLLCFKVKDADPPSGLPKQTEKRDVRVIFRDETPTPVAAGTPTPGLFTTVKVSFLKAQLLCMPAALIPPTPTPAVPCAAATPPCVAPLVCALDDFTCRPPTPTP
jgi:hypothetical protein